MPNRKLTISMALLLIIALSGCRTKVEFEDIGLGDDKVFLQCFLNPVADSITLSISIAKGTISTGHKIDPSLLPGSEVLIESGGISKEMNFIRIKDGGTALFSLSYSEMPVLPGQSYTVRITNDTHYQLKAATTIPSENFDLDFEYSGPIPNEQGGAYYKINYVINDEPGVPNYYRGLLEHPGAGAEYWGWEILVDDDKGNRDIIKAGIEVGSGILDSGESDITITSLTEDLYLYFKGIKTILSNGENPFSEPSVLHSNVEGGLGILGGMYTRSKPFTK